MNSHASYIVTAYSFIHSLSEEKIGQVGNLSAEGNPIPSFDENLLINLCEDVTRIFQKEENIIEIEGDAIVVGDIHGSFHDLLRIIRFIENYSAKVIFLGDYVDRGDFSIECITLLFALKVLKPNTFYLLRGNHEFNDMCSHYGFKQEIINYHNPYKCTQIPSEHSKLKIKDEVNFNFDIDDKEKQQTTLTDDSYFNDYSNMNCYRYSEKLYNAFMKAFSYLPISAIINKTSICLHGGLSPLLDDVENIKTQIKRPISDFDENMLLSDITWGDPCTKLKSIYGENQRGKGKLFSGPAVVNFLKNNHLKRIIRAHECVSNGVEELFNKKCITVFSASSYSGENSNSSGILMIYKKDDLVKPIIFNPIQRPKKCDINYYKVETFIQKVESNPTLLKFPKNGFVHSFGQVSSVSCDNFHYHTSRKHSSIHNSTKELKVPKLLPKPKKRLSCVYNSPLILTPQVTKCEK